MSVLRWIVFKPSIETCAHTCAASEQHLHECEEELTRPWSSPRALGFASQKLSGFDSASFRSLLMFCRFPEALKIRIVLRHCRTALCP